MSENVGRYFGNGTIITMTDDDAGAGAFGFINISDTWKVVSTAYINIGDTWKTVVEMKLNVGDSWKTLVS